MKKKTIFAALLLVVLLVMPFTVKAQQYLVLTQGDGSQVEFALADNPVITLEAGNLVVSCGDQQLTTSLEGTTYSFSDTPSAIHQVSTESQTEARVAFGQVAFTGLKAGSRVVVYTLDGRQMMSVTASEEGRATADLGSLPRGIYVVKAPGKTIKVKN